MQENPLPDAFRFEAVTEYALFGADLPSQTLAGVAFGEPPVMLAHREHFRIEAYYWLHGSTNIHEHQFSGSFMLITGRSLHSRYSFNESKKLNENVAIGELRHEQSELLYRGDVRTILAGEKMIHSLFHLDAPSLTLCVRTKGDNEIGAQRDFLPPGISLTSFRIENILIMQRRLLQTMSQVTQDKNQELLSRYFRESSVEGKIRGLFAIAPNFASNHQPLRGLAQMIAGSDDDLFRLLWAACNESFRNSELLSLRKEITDPEHRLFLAFLLNLPGRTAILNAIKREFPAVDPIEKIMRWTAQLAKQQPQKGTKTSSNVIGLELSPSKLAGLHGMLRGLEGDALHEFVKEKLQAQDETYVSKDVELAQLILPLTLFFQPLFKK